MTQFVHPSKEEITLAGLLGAFADPVRLCIFKSLMNEKGCMSCSGAAPRQDIPKSTLSHHFRVMRESGLIRTTKQGVEHRNIIRVEDINERFPGLLKIIIKLVESE
jgi:predicted transcriptional regulator